MLHLGRQPGPGWHHPHAADTAAAREPDLAATATRAEVSFPSLPVSLLLYVASGSRVSDLVRDCHPGCKVGVGK